MPKSKPRDERLAEREVRTVTVDLLELRADDAAPDAINVTGHAAVFESPTWIGPPRWGFSEVIARGAFTKTLADGADVRYLFNHNPDAVLARTKSGTLQLAEDKVGLAVDASLAPTQTGRDVAVLIERGDVSQMSFGFRVLADEWEELKGADGNVYERRTIKEVELFDVSAVTYPAYEDTDASLAAANRARELRGRPARRPSRPAGSTGTTRQTDATVEELAAAADATIDAIEDAWMADQPDQAYALLTALDETIDSMLELLGIPDPDENEEGEGEGASAGASAGGYGRARVRHLQATRQRLAARAAAHAHAATATLTEPPPTPTPLAPATATPPDPPPAAPAAARDPAPSGVDLSPATAPATATQTDGTPPPAPPDADPPNDPPPVGAVPSAASAVASAVGVPMPDLDPTTPEPSAAVETLIRNRAVVWDKMQALLAQTEGRTWSGEELQSWKRMEADLDIVERSLESATRGLAIKARLEAPASAPVSTRTATAAERGRPADYASDMRDVSGLGGSERAAAYERAFETYVRRGESRLNPGQQALLETGRSAEFRDLSLTSAAGGYTVPPGFVQKLTDFLKLYGGMLQSANVIQTDTGQPLQWPTSDDTGNTGAILAEGTTIGTSVDVTFSTRTLGAYLYSSKLVKISVQLLQDSAFDLNNWLPMKLGQRVGRAINAHFTNGTGAGAQPVGLVPNVSVGKQGIVGQTTSVIYDDIVDLIHSVDPAYRHVAVNLEANPNGSFGPNAGFMMADTSLKVIRKLKDSQGHPLWQPSLEVGMPSTLLGYPISINQDMPVMAASAKSIAFGDYHAAYVIRQVAGYQLLRLSERFADTLQVGFLAFGRFDGNVDDSNAVKLYQNSAT